MFEIGSFVVYRAEGVCRISDIRVESFGALGGEESYYILTPKNDEKSTVYVPVANDRLVAMMRPLLSADEIRSTVSELRELRVDWVEESRARNTRFREILSVGDRRELIVLANTIVERADLASRGEVKKLTGSDENTLRRIVRMLFEEFSMTCDLTEDQILPLLAGDA